MPETEFIFSVFICAHLLSEFVILPLWTAGIRNAMGRKALSAIVFALSVYLLAGQWCIWAVVPGAVLLYAAAAFFSARSLRPWLAVELLRFALFGGAAILAAALFEISFSALAFKIMIMCSGLLFSVFWIGELVGLSARELATKNNLTLHGLENGGLWIGRLERLLIFLFLFMNAPAGVGFLVAAKSVLRFSETREDQRMAEYVLIGTLMSFALAIAAAFLTHKVLSYFLSTIR